VRYSLGLKIKIDFKAAAIEHDLCPECLHSWPCHGPNSSCPDEWTPDHECIVPRT